MPEAVGDYRSAFRSPQHASAVQRIEMLAPPLGYEFAERSLTLDGPIAQHRFPARMRRVHAMPAEPLRPFGLPLTDDSRGHGIPSPPGDEAQRPRLGPVGQLPPCHGPILERIVALRRPRKPASLVAGFHIVVLVLPIVLPTLRVGISLSHAPRPCSSMIFPSIAWLNPFCRRRTHGAPKNPTRSVGSTAVLSTARVDQKSWPPNPGTKPICGQYKQSLHRTPHAPRGELLAARPI